MADEYYSVYAKSQSTNERNEYLTCVKSTRVPSIGEKIYLDEHFCSYMVEDVRHITRQNIKKNLIRNIVHSILPSLRARCLSKGKHLETIASIEVIVRKEDK